MGGRRSQWRLDVGLVAGLAVLAGVCLLVAIWTFGLGAGDQRYQLADLREDPLYLRGPGPRVVGGAVLSVVVLAAWAAAWKLATRSVAGSVRAGPGATPHGGTVPVDGEVASPPQQAWSLPRPSWWWSVPVVLAAAWGGYLAGSAAGLAAGGPVDHSGTMRLGFGAPIDATTEVPATCRTPPGDPGTIAVVTAPDAGLRVVVADAVTGTTRAYPEPFGVSIERSGHLAGRDGGGPTLVPPGLPDRPPMYVLNTGVDALIAGPPVSFMDAYFYVATAARVGGRDGSVTAAATRARAAAFVVNDLIPGDPWPDTFELTLEWTCDLGSVAAPTSPPRPTGTTGGGTPGSAQTPQPRLGSSPPPTAAIPATVPVEVWIVTGSEAATVRLDGATVASVGPPVIQGRGATATHGADALRVTQPAADAAAGHVVGARFPVTLSGIVPGVPLRLTIEGGPTGPVAVTIYNALGEEPVPVFVHEGISAQQPGWPIEVDPRWLASPLRVDQGW